MLIPFPCIQFSLAISTFHRNRIIINRKPLMELWYVQLLSDEIHVMSIVFEIIRRFSLNLKNSRWRTTWWMKWMRCCCPWLKKKFQMEGKLLWTVTKIFLCYQIIVKKTISIGQQIFTFLFSFFLTVSGCCIMQRISKATLNFQGSNFGRRSCVIVILF